MNAASYFQNLVTSITRIARHAYYPGKEEAVELCLQELDDLQETGRITAAQRTELRELLLGEENSCLVEGMIRERVHPEMADTRARIAILCEGAGTLAAFSAGVLQGVLEAIARPAEVVALGGTGFGSISALLAWDGLLWNDRRQAIEQLQGFWRDYTAASLYDTFVNYSTQVLLLLRALAPLPGPGTDDLASVGRDQLRGMLERRMDFARARSMARAAAAPRLAVGALDHRGELAVVRGREIEVDAILSAAVGSRLPRAELPPPSPGPDATREPDSPLRCLFESKPSEIWLVETSRAERRTCEAQPGQPLDVLEYVTRDRLEQELRLVRTINRLLQRGSLIDGRYRVIDVHRIVMEHDLDRFSAMDRSPGLINGLMSYGRDRAGQFLEKRQQILSGRSRSHVML